MHPLLALLATRPQLFWDHAQAYAALLHEDFGLASTSWRQRVLLHALAVCSLGVTAVLAGGALMLTRPWRWISAPALWAGILPQLLSEAMKHMQSQTTTAATTGHRHDDAHPQSTT